MKDKVRAMIYTHLYKEKKKSTNLTKTSNRLEYTQETKEESVAEKKRLR